MEVLPILLNHRGVDHAALRATPPDHPPAPGVVVVHDAWGLDDEAADLVAALADAGFAVLAPDLLAGRRAADADEAAAFAAGLDPEDAGLLLAAAVDALAADAATRRGSMGAVGVGMGAPLAAFLATIRPEVGVAVLAGPVPDLPIETWARAEAAIVVLLDAAGAAWANGEPDANADEDAAVDVAAALDRARAAGRAVKVVESAGDGSGDHLAAAIVSALAEHFGMA